MRKADPRNTHGAAPVDGHEAERIDRLYGLEPVIETDRPGDSDGESGPLHFCTVQCPYCGEEFETPVDTSAGAARYIEDCAVCCQPIEFSAEVDAAGAFHGLTVSRGD